MIKLLEMDLELQPFIAQAPVTPSQMYSAACSSDTVTIDSWRDIWINNAKENHKKFGPFKDKSLGKLYNKYRYMPAIVAGSGPSLKENAKFLKEKGGIPLFSALHNFHFMVDNGIEVDYYVTLDAGDITISEISEGGKESHDYYIEQTKGKTLLAFVSVPPKLLEIWKGDIYFYNAPIPNMELVNTFDEIEKFHCYVSSGGHVLGAAMYIAKAIMGCGQICVVGGDFSFSYKKKFHSWDSHYDQKLGNAIRVVDIYGNLVWTWQSYYNFKHWWDYLATKIMPFMIVNSTEGGCLGAYREGNIMQLNQIPLQQFIKMYNMNGQIQDQCENPETDKRILLF